MTKEFNKMAAISIQLLSAITIGKFTCTFYKLLFIKFEFISMNKYWFSLGMQCK